MTRICPKCKSKNVSVDLSVRAYGQGSIFNSYTCNDCGYTSILFPEITKEKKVKKKK
jgi:transposase-like protein